MVKTQETQKTAGPGCNHFLSPIHPHSSPSPAYRSVCMWLDIRHAPLIPDWP
ncbi:hypothetical protein CSHISOI_02172 [Colletotrichum shisoi]|uniref:Uncharacterized protein n=1 Tax=Colletotrichum shisoi TaxID=2078593 RepID=A0A5Q4C468_9PEZI|nr:hypothetical protein CSHISOI_02172 [Colletotrichum shisoi]